MPKAYGFPISDSKKLGVDDYFKSRPDVAGMAWGGGENGSTPTEVRSVVHNPYNENMRNPSKRDALYKIEAARHIMSKEPIPDFQISPALQKWREASFKEGDPYRTNDKAFRETVVSRVMVGDTGENPDMPMPVNGTVEVLAGNYNRKLTPDRQFDAWKAKYAPNDSGVDYDLYGAFKAGVKPNGKNGHFTDTFKLPNHPTFSAESKYSTPETPGGVWDDKGFTPSAWMIRDPKRLQELDQYMKKNEPKVKLNVSPVMREYISQQETSPKAVTAAEIFSR